LIVEPSPVWQAAEATVRPAAPLAPALSGLEADAAALSAWRVNQVERLHAAAATGEAPTQEIAREARAAAQDAADEIESAKSVLVDCEARARDAKDTR
jgi:hypothetical protein